jgi:hypothetical protein
MSFVYTLNTKYNSKAYIKILYLSEIWCIVWASEVQYNKLCFLF